MNRQVQNLEKVEKYKLKYRHKQIKAIKIIKVMGFYW